MSERDLLFVVFAPATVGLVVMACRRLPPLAYLVISVAVVVLATLSVGGAPLGVDLSPGDRLALAVTILGVPAAAALGIGRLTALRLGGAAVFTVSCTAYLLGLGLAIGLFGPIGLLAP